MYKRKPSSFEGGQGNAVKLSEICDDSFRDEVSQVAQDSQVSQVSRMR